MGEPDVDERMVGDVNEMSVPMASKGAAEVKDSVSLLRKEDAVHNMTRNAANAAPPIEGGAAVEGGGGGSAIEDRAAIEEGVSNWV